MKHTPLIENYLTNLKRSIMDIHFLFKGLIMFSNVLFDNIRELENEIYGGPVAVEHTFDRKDSFQADHPRRRESIACKSSNGYSKKNAIWYTMKIDPETNDLFFDMGDR